MSGMRAEPVRPASLLWGPLTGLGLAVVKKIADEHGARVRIVNLGTSEGPGSATGSASTALGAQVSLSFSKLAPVPLRTSAAGIAAQAGSH